MSTACVQLGGSRVEFGENAIAAPQLLISLNILSD
jgi:hypothetical protein